MNDHGLGGKHLFPEIKKCIVALGRKSVKDVDTEYVYLCYSNKILILIFYLRMAAFLPWPGLNHFNGVMSLQFSNANKYRDVLKVCKFLVCARKEFALTNV